MDIVQNSPFVIYISLIFIGDDEEGAVLRLMMGNSGLREAGE